MNGVRNIKLEVPESSPVTSFQNIFEGESDNNFKNKGAFVQHVST